jgi:hypothetical protein
MVRISVQRLKERYTAKKDAAPLQYARYFRCALERIAHMLKDRMRQDRIKAIIDKSHLLCHSRQSQS